MPTDWTESNFQDELINTLDHYNIEYRTEVSLAELGDSTGSTRRIDIYIPKTDTALELKGREGDLHAGVGQALNYTRVCKEAILVLDGEATDSYRQDIHRTCQIAPAVHFAMIIPNSNPSSSGAGLDISTDSRPDLFYEMLYNVEWDDDMAVVKRLIPEYLDYEEDRWSRPLGQHSLNEYHHHTRAERDILEYLKLKPPVSFSNICQAVENNEPEEVREALRALCDENRVVEVEDDVYVHDREY